MIKPTNKITVAYDPETGETWSLQQLIDHVNGLEAQVEKLQRFIESKLSRAEIEKANAEMTAEDAAQRCREPYPCREHTAVPNNSQLGTICGAPLT